MTRGCGGIADEIDIKIAKIVVIRTPVFIWFSVIIQPAK
jgi:hypothetical protein